MKTLSAKILRVSVTLVLSVALVIFRACSFYTESPWTQDAKFTADVVAIAPDVSGLLSAVPIRDNQLVKSDFLLGADNPRYQETLAQAEVDVSYYPALAEEKKTRLSTAAPPRNQCYVPRTNRSGQ